MVLIKSRKGFLFTIATIILIIPLIYLVSFYSGVSETQMEDTIGRIRCDELHYYVEDVKRDMGRAVTIFGRRAAANAIEDVIQTGVPLRDYTFQCTPQCDCDKLIYPENGSEAAIAELIVCGTLHGENVTNMQDNTLPGWIERITEEGELMRFDVNITPFEIKVIPKDAWHFAIIIENKVRFSDKEGLCFYTENIMTAISNTSIIGLEDPLHLLENKERKYILDCEDPVLPRTMAGCGVNGSGISGGLAVLYSTDISDMNAYREYCRGESDIAPSDEELANQVFVLNQAPGLLCAASGMKECFNASMPRHFGAIIAYEELTAGQWAQCDITVPWIMGTGDLDDVNPPHHGGDPDPECFNGSFIESGDCIMVLTVEACDMYYVFFGYGSTDVNTSCYYVSDIEEHYNPECSSSERYSNGPCFFDRLDGNLNLSERYVDQANETFGTTLIGIESFVDIYTLYNLENLGYDVVVNSTYSWIDYLYWQNITGCDVVGYCEADNYSFNLDCPHAHKYNLDTNCEMVTTCPVCGDDFCSPLENCVTCPQDCECPGCPVFANLTDCKENCAGPTCDVRFTLSVMNGTGHPMNLSSDPKINITYDGAPVIPTPTMNQVVGETGRYVHTEFGKAKNKKIGGNISIKESGCPLLKNATKYMWINNPSFPGC